MNLHHQSYSKLLELLPDLHNMAKSVLLKTPGHSAVHVDLIERHPHRLVLRMSHYLQRLHGPAIPDPDITVEVYLLAKTVGVLIYCDYFGSRKVFCSELMAFSPLAKAELNNFLEQWLSKMIAEGRFQATNEKAQ